MHRSLERLRTDHVDLLQIHSMSGTDTLMPQMQEWKHAGKIRYLGLTTSSPRQHADMLSAMQRHRPDFIQIDYSIANREAAKTVLPAAHDLGVGVLVNLPLGRATLLRRLAERPLPPWATEIGVHSWGQFLLNTWSRSRGDVRDSGARCTCSTSRTIRPRVADACRTRYCAGRWSSFGMPSRRCLQHEVFRVPDVCLPSAHRVRSRARRAGR